MVSAFKVALGLIERGFDDAVVFMVNSLREVIIEVVVLEVLALPECELLEALALPEDEPPVLLEAELLEALALPEDEPPALLEAELLEAFALPEDEPPALLEVVPLDSVAAAASLVLSSLLVAAPEARATSAMEILEN
jgi:hypothetical protein